jgi:hypothetical protein
MSSTTNRGPSIFILPAHPTDASTLARLHYKSFSSDTGLQTSSFPTDRPLTADEESSYLAWRTARQGARIEKEDFHVFKAVDQSSGSIVGCVSLKSPKSSDSRRKNGGHSGGENVGEDGEKPKVRRYEGAPEFLNMTVFSEMEAKAAAAKEKFVGNGEMWCKFPSPFSLSHFSR